MTGRPGRRNVLGIAGAGIASGLTGCLDGLLGGDQQETTAPGPVQSGGWRDRRHDPARTGTNADASPPALGDSRTIWGSPDRPTTPLVGTERALYFGTEEGTVFAIDPADGTERWTASFPAGCSGASLGPDLLYTSTTAGKIAGIDADGDEHRRIDLPANEPTGVTAIEDTIFAWTESRLFAVETPLETIDWQWEPEGSPFRPSVGTDGLVVPTRRSLHGLAFDGSRRWTMPNEDGGRIFPVSDGVVYVVRPDAVVEAVSVATGERRWSRTLPGRVFGFPAVGDHLYVVAGEDDDRRLFAVRPEGRIERKVDFAFVTRSSPVVAGNTVFVRGDGFVRAYDEETGEPVDDGPLGHESYLAGASPIVVDGHLAVVDPHFEGTAFRLFAT